jgi:rubrerythrin
MKGRRVRRDRGRPYFEVALAAETAGLENYESTFVSASDPEIEVLAETFVDDERGQVTALQKSLAM